MNFFSFLVGVVFGFWFLRFCCFCYFGGKGCFVLFFVFFLLFCFVCCFFFLRYALGPIKYE